MAMAMSEAEVAVFLARAFPQLRGACRLERLSGDSLVLRQRAGAQDRGDGGLAGPALMTLAEIAFLLAVLSRVGAEAQLLPRHAAIDHLSGPDPRCDLMAEARILHLDPARAVGDVLLWSDGAAGPAARIGLACDLTLAAG